MLRFPLLIICLSIILSGCTCRSNGLAITLPDYYDNKPLKHLKNELLWATLIGGALWFLSKLWKVKPSMFHFQKPKASL